jgi:hypothetical protein
MPESTPVPNPDELAKAFAFLVSQHVLTNFTVIPGFRSETGWSSVLDSLFTGVHFAQFATGDWNKGSSCCEVVIFGSLVDDVAKAGGKLTAKAGETLNLQWQTSLPRTSQPRVVEAPAWLVRRMETLRQMPPPTLQEVDTQLKASAEARKKLIGRQPA